LDPSPTAATRVGRSRQIPLRKDWERVKEDIMREALRAKFSQHDSLRGILLGTGNKTLIEHTANDSYWADGGDGSGKNRLGALLMELRDEIRSSLLCAPNK
jgi:N-glycosidase YbiA